MATLSQLHTGFAAAMATIDSIGARTYTEAEAQVETPGVVVRSAEPAVIYNTSTGSHDYQLAPLLLVTTSAGALALDVLQPYLDVTGADSVYAAVQADPTLGGACDSAVVVQVARAGIVAWGGVEYLGAEFLVNVLA